MGLVKTRRLAAMQKQQKAKLGMKPPIKGGALGRTFGSARYMRKLASARINWIGISPQIATGAIMKIVESL